MNQGSIPVPPQPQPQPSATVQPTTPSSVYVSFSAEIIPHTMESLIATCTNIANKGA